MTTSWNWTRYDDGSISVHAGEKQTPYNSIIGTPRAAKVTDAALNLLCAAPDLLDVLTNILNAHDSGNNGAYMGEAVICEAFAHAARAAIVKARGE
jgi:hypothetical protein